MPTKIIKNQAAIKDICQRLDNLEEYMLGHDLTGKRCNPRDLDKNPYSEAELARHNKFAQVREAMAALTPEQMAEYQAAFEKYPGKYSTLNGYIFAKEYEKLA